MERKLLSCGKKSQWVNLRKNTILNSKNKKFLEAGLMILIVFVLSILTLSAANPNSNPPGRDGGFFLYVGKTIRSGSKLYIDIWDSKGPLIFWINAIGVGSDYSRWGLFFIELSFLSSALFLSYWIIKRQYGFLPALGTIVMGSYFLKFVIGTGNYTEEYSILFTWLAIAAFAFYINNSKKNFWPFYIMGVTFFLNFLLRANNIGTQAVVILVALYCVFNKQKAAEFWKVLSFLIIGALTVAIPTSLYFIMNGNFKAMIDASILYNFAYSTSRNNSFSNCLGPAINIFNNWFYVFITLWLFAARKLVLGLKQKVFDPFILLTVFAFPMEVLMSSVSGRGYGHYFICWIPAVMLLLAFGLSIIQSEAIKTSFRQKCETKYSTFILGFLLFVAIASSFDMVYSTANLLAANLIPPNTNFDYQDSVSKVVNSLTNESDKVLVFGGQAGINIMAQRDSIKGALFYPGINDSEIGLAVQDKFFENLQEEPPLLILDGHRYLSQQIPAIDPMERQSQRFVVNFSRNVEEVLDWINTHYERFDEANDYIIYRYRGDFN
ncbi:MAG: hypothetical protein GXX97_07080 [Dehalococcoidales bacterium]|nr:hypothetical protein [Dehalococcoidales bacterium]